MILTRRASTEPQAFLDKPALAAPPGMHHNFVNPTNLTTEAQIITICCLSLSVLAVGMRIWTNTRVVRRAMLEDGICCLALATFAAHCTVLFVVLKKQISGTHQWNIRLKDVRYYAYHSRIIIAAYSIEILLIKVTILLQYLRVLVPLKTRNLMFWASHTLIWLNVTFYSILFFLALFPCKPVKKYWNPWIEGRCIDDGKLSVFVASFNAASDILILILPQPLIWRLHMTLKRKIALSAVFLVGICACASTVVRIYYSVKIIQTKDRTYYYSILDLWSLIEVVSGFLAACLPHSPKFFKSIKDSDLWSGLRNSLHFWTQSTTKSTSVITRANEYKPARFRDGLSSINALFKKYNILPHEIEMTTSTKGGEKSNTQADHWTTTETSQTLESMRSIHTTMMDETGSASRMTKTP